MNELIGGMRNALERGETLNKAKQSFINAGYKNDEVESAAQQLSQTSSFNALPQTNQNPQNPKNLLQNLPAKHLSKRFVIILIVLGALILIGAGLLGIYWERLFT